MRTTFWFLIWISRRNVLKPLFNWHVYCIKEQVSVYSIYIARTTPPSLNLHKKKSPMLNKSICSYQIFLEYRPFHLWYGLLGTGSTEWEHTTARKQLARRRINKKSSTCHLSVHQNQFLWHTVICHNHIILPAPIPLCKNYQDVRYLGRTMAFIFTAYTKMYPMFMDAEKSRAQRVLQHVQ